MYEVFKPKSEILKKHIVSFNILKKDIDFERINYFVFPQKGTTIGIFKNTKVDFNHSQINISNSKEENCKIVVFGKYLIPLYLQYESFVDEISINFTPTGINYFFDESMSAIAPNNIQLLENENWDFLPTVLFKQKNSNDRIEALELFLLKNLNNKELTSLEDVVTLFENDTEQKISKVAKTINLSERSINRYFKSYIGCSPAQFKKICRFRSAIENKFDDTENLNLTEICLNNNFYDSPHFTNEFKKLTNNNPRKFFSKVVKVGKDNYPYIFS